MSREEAARISGKIDDEIKVCCRYLHLSILTNGNYRKSLRAKGKRAKDK